MQHQIVIFANMDINTCIDTTMVRTWHNPYQLTLYVNVCEWDISCPSRSSTASRGEWMVQWFNSGKNYTPYKSIQDFLKMIQVNVVVTFKNIVI